MMPTDADVPFEQCVDRLGRRVRDELDLVGTDLLRHLGDAAHDSRGHAFGRVVRRREHRLGHDAGLEVDGHGLRERPSDVDPDANGHQAGAAVGAIGRGTAARRASRGFTRKT